MGEGGKRARDLILRQFESVPRFRSVPQWLSQTITALGASDLFNFFPQNRSTPREGRNTDPSTSAAPSQPDPHLSLQTAASGGRRLPQQLPSPPPPPKPAPRCGLKASLGHLLPRAEREGAGHSGSLTAPGPRAGVSEGLGASRAAPRPEGRGCSPAAVFPSGSALGLGTRRSCGGGPRFLRGSKRGFSTPGLSSPLPPPVPKGAGAAPCRLSPQNPSHDGTGRRAPHSRGGSAAPPSAL